MPLAAALHSQDSTQRLPVHGDGDEIISRRDGRCATEATEPAPPAATADRCATEGLRHESQRAAATTAATGRLTGTPQQVAERREERRVGCALAGLAAAFATPPRRGQRAYRRRRARGRLTGTFDESSAGQRRSSTPTATAPSTTKS